MEQLIGAFIELQKDLVRMNEYVSTNITGKFKHSVWLVIFMCNEHKQIIPPIADVLYDSYVACIVYSFRKDFKEIWKEIAPRCNAIFGSGFRVQIVCGW